jgi:hypothetical protein
MSARKPLTSGTCSPSLSITVPDGDPIAPDRRDPNIAAHLRDYPPYAEKLEALRPCDD